MACVHVLVCMDSRASDCACSPNLTPGCIPILQQLTPICIAAVPVHRWLVLQILHRHLPCTLHTCTQICTQMHTIHIAHNAQNCTFAHCTHCAPTTCEKKCNNKSALWANLTSCTIRATENLQETRNMILMIRLNKLAQFGGRVKHGGLMELFTNQRILPIVNNI